MICIEENEIRFTYFSYKKENTSIPFVLKLQNWRKHTKTSIMDFKSFFVCTAFILLVALLSEGSCKRLSLFHKQKRSAQAASVDWCTSPFKNYAKFSPRFLELYCPQWKYVEAIKISHITRKLEKNLWKMWTENW